MLDGKKVYINKIVTNKGQEISFNYDDIIVFVGPNNVGKSQCLKDIYNLAKGSNSSKSIVLKSMEMTNDGIDPSVILQKYGHNDKNNSLSNNFYHVINNNILDTKLFAGKEKYGHYRELFIANLTTSNRLSIVNPPSNINGEEIYNHPILYAGYIQACRKWLSDNFKKAFGSDLIPNTICGNTVPLCIGDNPDFNNESFSNDLERLERLREVLGSYEKVHDQGDGIKSFVGILLYLMLDFFQTYLIDEPESFLHQPQANIMGRIIGESTIGRQCFISTHSESLIKGLLDSAPNRVKIIRITREKNVNYFSCLDNEALHKIWNNPILKHSDIMSGLFYKSVVLCESDSDCKFYSIINDHLKSKDNKYSESLFVHCGGKHRIPDVVAALKSLNIQIKVVVDIDVLSDRDNLKAIVKSLGYDYEDIKKEHDIITASLSSKGGQNKKEDILCKIKNIVESTNDKYLSTSDLEHIKKIIKPNSSWIALKENGIYSIPSGDATNAAKNLLEKMQNIGLFIVPYGELESFIKEVGGHGPQWVNEVLKQYPDFDNDIYKNVKEFVKKMNL